MSAAPLRLLALLFLGVAAWGCGGDGADRSAEFAGEAASHLRLVRVLEVAGRQGVATDGVHYWVSGSTALYRYSKEGELLAANEEPFADLEKSANHIGDIDVHEGEIHAGIEWFVDGRGRDIQIAVYDAQTLLYRRSIDWDPDSGQVEVSAVAVDPDRRSIWMSDWVNGAYLYRYGLDSGAYEGRLHLRPVPQWQQGLAYRDGWLFISADDGDADLEEADNLWRVSADPGVKAAYVSHVKELGELRRSGEVEGLTFDLQAGELVVLSNRGARIHLGMPGSFYPGYDREIHELYVFRLEAKGKSPEG